MIAPTSELLPSENATAIPTSGCCTIMQPSSQERLSSARMMRNQLFLLDPAERRMSIEDYIALVLDPKQTENQA